MRKINLLITSFIVFLFALVVLQNPDLASAQVSQFNLTATPGPASGQVTLNWHHYHDVSNYNIVYGPSSGNWLWGASNIGNVTSFTVGSLTPGQRYYFALQPSTHPTVGGFMTDSVSAVAAGGSAAASKQQPQTPTQTVPSNATSGPVSSPYNLTAKTGGKGQVMLTWVNSGPSYSFDVVHGHSAGNWLWGAQDVNGGTAGTVNQFMVDNLVPGQLYYFAILPQFNGHGTTLSSSVAAVAGR